MKAGISVAKLGRQLQVRIYWRLRNSKFSSDGAMTIVRVTASDGNSAMNYVLEVKTLDGLRFMMGFHGFGSFSEEKLEELGKLLEEKSRGRELSSNLVFRDLIKQHPDCLYPPRFRL
ncbi:MAG: hypothetical protein ABJQ67_02630 [Marinobacter sp.]